MRARRRVVVHQNAIVSIKNEQPPLIERLALLRGNDEGVAPPAEDVIEVTHFARRQPIEDGVGRGWIEEGPLQTRIQGEGVVEHIIWVSQ